jgi:hypothetical protein
MTDIISTGQDTFLQRDYSEAYTISNSKVVDSVANLFRFAYESFLLRNTR